MYSAYDHLIERLVTDPEYEVRIDGTVWSKALARKSGTWRQLKNRVTEQGYIRIQYDQRPLFLHRVMYRKFVGPLDPKAEVHHADGDKTNNDPANLVQVTRSEHRVNHPRSRNRWGEWN